MARTLILNISAEVQTLPAAYGSFTVAVGHGRVVSDESSVVVTAMGGFSAMDGKWAVSAISTDTALGDLDVAANGVAMLATYVPGGVPTWASVQNKPTFSTVATSGSYTDLIDKPALADVAESGDYADLSNTPAIPVASNVVPNDVSTTGAAGVGSSFARGDHQHAHGNLSGGALHSNATTIAAGFMSAADKSKLDGLATVASSGSYSDLSDKPAKTYDIASYASGALTVGTTVAQVIAPKNLTLTALTQTGGATAAVKVNGGNAVYPQSVTTGQVISVVVTVAGTGNTFTISAVEA